MPFVSSRDANQDLVNPQAPNIQAAAVLYRLSPEVFKKLQAKLPSPIVGASTTPTEAAYLLGIQYVVGLLRDGFVMEA